MLDEPRLIEIKEARDERRLERREFFRTVGAAAAVTGGVAVMAGVTPLSAQTAPAPTDADIFNFALNLEYLEATFYSRAVFGRDLDADQTAGTGTQGAPIPTGVRQVQFADAGIAAIAREIAADELTHVRFIRNVLGSAAVSRPVLDLSVSPTSAFSAAARAAGLIGANDSFDPYANDNNFLLASFIFEDLGVTAYKGASPLITNKTFLEAAAGILAVEAYHAGTIRTTLYARGMQTPSLIAATESISTARDSLDGPTDLDQGVAPMGTGNTAASNIVPTDANGIAFSRSAGQVLNVAYLNRAAVMMGGFFPAGVNGPIRTSANNA
jgi:hypothetical protein